MVVAKAVQFYTYPSCTSCRKAKMWLTENGINYEERHLLKDPPSIEELKDIMRLTTNGFDDILSTRSQKYKELDMDIEDMNMTQLLEMISEEPRLLRRPLIIDGEHLIVGYNKSALRSILA
ncbi:Spx/MgsR family RNA polymerase-binding regulatory protein [Rubeoparvulum massiliense]|uniref:Spx/MgsR family RNA polymerase-binding regulatory protein n=1 Tax=Rubeoparvulum massiliense TaxID=1631346 RepID=UPI00065E5ECD|nr:Spx/MgsR family RNA polymerase-binding regulatory protein [Rubeoparvulum massiliense]